MSDDKTKKDGRDRSKIDCSDNSEVYYAAKTWGCTTDDIRKAAEMTGSSTRKVIYAWLKKESII